jgi:hypothetical protein
MQSYESGVYCEECTDGCVLLTFVTVVNVDIVEFAIVAVVVLLLLLCCCCL